MVSPGPDRGNCLTCYAVRPSRGCLVRRHIFLFGSDSNSKIQSADDSLKMNQFDAALNFLISLIFSRNFSNSVYFIFKVTFDNGTFHKILIIICY